MSYTNLHLANKNIEKLEQEKTNILEMLTACQNMTQDLIKQNKTLEEAHYQSIALHKTTKTTYLKKGQKQGWRACLQFLKDMDGDESIKSHDDMSKKVFDFWNGYEEFESVKPMDKYKYINKEDED